jgi:hypothetical protein
MGVGKGLRLGPVARLSFGLVALVVGLLVGMDLIFDVMPDRQREERHLRQRFAESLAAVTASSGVELSVSPNPTFALPTGVRFQFCTGQSTRKPPLSGLGRQFAFAGLGADVRCHAGPKVR